MRQSKTSWYLQLARDVALRSSCQRRQFGAVIVKDDAIISTGYNGSIRGAKNCGEDSECLKNVHGEAKNQSYAFCSSVHAEVNSIINAARSGVSVLGATLYLNSLKDGDGDRPCYLCRRVIVNSGIKKCIYRDSCGTIRIEDVSLWIDMENQWMKEKLGDA